MVINSAHLLGQTAAVDDRLLPLLWALDTFKNSQAQDVKEGDWTLAKVDESRDPTQGRADWIGTVLFTGSLFGLVFGLIRGNREGWSSTLIVAMLAGAAVLMAAFLFAQLRVQSPMLELRLFRKPAFVGASTGAFVLSAAMFAMFLYLTLYIQNILGYSALQSGLRFMPTTLLSFLVAPASGKLAERLGVRWFMAAGLVLVGVGLLLMAGLRPGDDWTALLAGFLIAGGGIGLINPALATAAIGVVEPRQAGMASGINSTFRQVGIATGIAAWGAIFEHVVRTTFIDDARAAGLHGPPAGRAPGGTIADFVTFGGAQRTGNHVLARVGEQAFTTGLNHILVLAAIVAFVGALVSGLLVRPADFVGERAGARAAAPAAAQPAEV
jgi:Na+/melibiose symporter-like transporter